VSKIAINSGSIVGSLRGRFPLSRCMAWLSKGVLAVLDQGLVSGSNFVIGVLLARSLGPEQYGSYALAFSIFLFLAAFHQNLVLSPLSVFGPSQYSQRTRDYLGAVLWIQTGFGALVMLFLLASAAITRAMHQPEMASALVGLSFGAPCILMFWLARASQYLKLAPGPAAAAAAFYCITIGAGLLLLKRAAALSPFSVYVLMGIGSLVASYLLFRTLKPRMRPSRRELTVASVWREHWTYGRWELSSGLVYWLGENVWLMMTGFFLGVADVGGLRSVTNLVLPASHIMVAAGRLIQPHASRVSGEQGPGATANLIHTVAVLLATGAFGYFALVTALHVPLMRLLYGGKFMEYAYLAPWMTLGLVFQAATQAYNVGLRALRFPSSLLIIYGVSTGVGVIGGLPATYAFGLHGMIVAAVISNFALGLTAMLLFRAKAGAPAQAVTTIESVGFDPIP
jgi:O-antigen/teichoic acid export membrane protein